MPASMLLPLSDPTLARFGSYGLYDHLQADLRPTFLVGLSLSDGLGQNVDTSRAYFNASLSANNALLDRIARVLVTTSSRDDLSYDEITEFRSWILGDAQGSIWFGKILWSATNIDSKWRVVSGVPLPKLVPSAKSTTTHTSNKQLDTSQNPPEARMIHEQLTQHSPEVREAVESKLGAIKLHHTDILLPSAATPTDHQRYLQTYDWTKTTLGPIETWPQSLYQAIKLALACPLGVLVYWGPARNIIWNDASIRSLRGFDGVTPGFSAFDVFRAWWADSYELICKEVERTGRAIALSKEPGPLIERDGGLRETFWSYNYMPILDDNGGVCGIYGLVHDTTVEVLMEGRINTLLKVTEAMGTATDLSSFWQVTFAELQKNPADIPLAAVYSMGSEAMIDCFTDLGIRRAWQASSDISSQRGMHTVTRWALEGKIGFPDDHMYFPSELAFDGADSLSVTFRDAMATPNPSDILLCTEHGIIATDSLVGCHDCDLEYKSTQLVLCPLQRPSGGVIAWIVLGINPRRTFDDEYKRFTRLLSRHVESKLVLILTLEREKKIAFQSAEEAAYQQQQLYLQLQQQRREIEQSHARFFRFAKQAPVYLTSLEVGVYVFGREGEIKFANDAWYKILGIAPETAGPKAWLARTHPDDVNAINRQWKLLIDGFAQDRFEWRVLKPGSTTFENEDDILYMESCFFPEIAENGTLESVTGLTTDVSIHKAYQREQTEKLKVAIEAKRAQEYFMDMVSHEMRNPLNAIIQCAEESAQLVESLKDKIRVDGETSAMVDDFKDMVHTILYCGTHQKQLIDDVLTLSKLDSNLLVVFPVKIYPEALLNQALKVFSSEIRTSDINVYTSPNNGVNGDEQSSAIMVDPSRIVQILINLISNAIKFMKGREKRELHIKLHVSQERESIEGLHYISSGQKHSDPTTEAEWGTGESVYLNVSVRDTGPGLSDTEMRSLFTRFRQASPRTHVDYGGSGLGLFISRELAELHGGEIGLVSRVNLGTTFIFYVKGRRHIHNAEILKHDPPRRTSVQHSGRNSEPGHKIIVTTPRLDTSPSAKLGSASALHLLVVEDNEINRKVLKRQLQKLGYQVTIAVHGEEALTILQTSTWWQGNQTQHSTTLPKSNETRPQFSVILCDLEMPVMDGATCVRQIRRWQHEGLLHINIPVFAVTGNARAEKTLLGTGSDFDYVVSKPYSFTDLVEQILAHVDQSAVESVE